MRVAIRDVDEKTGVTINAEAARTNQNVAGYIYPCGETKLNLGGYYEW